MNDRPKDDKSKPAPVADPLYLPIGGGGASYVNQVGGGGGGVPPNQDKNSSALFDDFLKIAITAGGAITGLGAIFVISGFIIIHGQSETFHTLGAGEMPKEFLLAANLNFFGDLVDFIISKEGNNIYHRVPLFLASFLSDCIGN
jgi:hypothetical protein